MHVTLPGRDLAAALKSVLTVIERRNTIPVLGAARMTFKNGQLHIVGTDLDMELHVRLDVIDASDDFDLVVPAKLAYEAARFAGPAPVKISQQAHEEATTDGKGKQKVRKVDLIHIEVADGDVAYTINKLASVADWPELLSSELLPEPLETFTNGHLAEMLATVMPAISTEETRYYLNGVYWEGTGSFTATDGHRLVSRTYTPTGQGNDVSVIIPRKAVAILAAIGTGDVQSAKMAGKERLIFIAGNKTFITKPIDGTYPDYKRVIPRDDASKHVFEFDAARLKDAVGRAISFYRSQSKNAIAFKPTADGREVQIASNAEERLLHTATNFAAKTFAKWPEAAPTFGLNMHYLNAFLPKTGRVSIHMDDGGSPMRFIIDGEEDTTRVVMPMRV